MTPSADHRRLTRAFRRMTIAMLIVLAAVYAQSYLGRVHLVAAERASCDRARVRDENAAIAWSVAAAQRERDGDTGTADAYTDTATVLWRYAGVDCRRAFPTANPFGF